MVGEIVGSFLADHEHWVAPAGVFSALADIVGAEVGLLIDCIIERGGYHVIKSIFFFGGCLRGSNPGEIGRAHV